MGCGPVPFLQGLDYWYSFTKLTDYFLILFHLFLTNALGIGGLTLIFTVQKWKLREVIFKARI